jgi:hypothetical protein
LYDNISGLNTAILRELANQQAKALINLSPDDSTQKVILKINEANTSVDFTQGDTPRLILGFNSEVVGPFAAVPKSVLAPNVASFNTISYFEIHSDLVKSGIRTNDTYSQTLTQVLIDVPPGSQIVSRPFNPPKVDVSELIGVRRSNFRMWLTDDSNRLVNTNSEFWSCRIVLRYLRKE